MGIPQKKTTKILMLGGEGFIGRNISAEIPDNILCHSLGIQKSAFGTRKDKYKKGDPYEEKITGDFDIFIHLIDNKTETGLFEKAEMKLVENINLARGHHMIIFSSAVVYANPDSDYGKRKLSMEKIYEDYCKKKGIRLTILRLFNIFGKFQIPFRQGSLVANIFYNHLEGLPIEINDFDAKRDFMYAGDLGKFINFIIENRTAGKFDLATGKLVSIKELVGKIEKIMGESINVVDKKKIENNVCPEAKGDIFENIKIIPMEDGLMETYDFYKNNLPLIGRILNV